MANPHPIPNRRFVAIEYPGEVKNAQKAIATLGGADTVKEVVIGHAPTIELRFNNKPFSRPLFGDHNVSSNFVLSITKHKTEMIGRIENTIRFKGMADFQYIPSSKRVVSAGDWENGTHSIEETANLPPPIFSRVDMPQEYLFRGNPAYKLANVTVDGQPTLRYVSSVAKSKQSKVVIVDWKDKDIPVRPYTEAKLPTIDKEKLARLEKKFQDRAVWSWSALKSSLGDDANILKKYYSLLPMVAYYFNNGPWRRVWVRMGYDPRNDPHSRIYQVIDLRVPSQLSKAAGITGVQRATIAPRRLKRPTTGVPFTEVQDGSVDTINENSENSTKATNEDTTEDHTFSVPPSHQQTLYQLTDISEPNIRHLINNTDSQPNCDEKTGWFNTQQIRTIRNYMKSKLKAMLGGEPIELGVIEGDESTPADESDPEEMETEEMDQVGREGYLQELMQSIDNPDFQLNDFQPYQIFGEDDDEYDDTEADVDDRTADSEDVDITHV